MVIEVTIATDDEIEDVVASVRDADRHEYAALSDRPMLETVKSAAKHHTVWIAKLDGQPIAIYSAFKRVALSSRATPWMLATPLIEDRRVIRAMARYGRQELLRATEGIGELWGIKIASDDRALRWLRWMGFTVDSPISMRGQTFYQVYMKRSAE